MNEISTKLQAIITTDIESIAKDEAGYYLVTTLGTHGAPVNIAFPVEILGKLVQAFLQHIPAEGTLPDGRTVANVFRLSQIAVYPAEDGFAFLDLRLGSATPLRLKLTQQEAKAAGEGLVRLFG